MTLGKLITFVMGFSYAYTIWCIYYYHKINKLYKEYLRVKQEEYNCLLEFAHNLYEINDFAWLLHQIPVFKFYFNDNSYRRYLKFRIVWYLFIAVLFTIIFIAMKNSEWSVYFNMSI